MLLETRLPIRYIFRRIMPDVLRVLFISIVFQLIKEVFGPYLPPVPLQLPTILGSSISLLLAFKISQSYDRWWEARRIWGAIVNDSRSLVLQLSSFLKPEAQVPGPDARTPVQAVAYRQIAWAYCLGQALRGLDPLEGLQHLLTDHELTYIKAHNNKPLALMALHVQQLRELANGQFLNSFQQIQLDATLVRLTESMGAAERINSTIFPTSYRLMVYYFIYLFLLTLSLGLVETIGLWEVPVLLLTASTYFLLERTARYLQDPFNNKPTDTPVTAIARTIEINLRQLLNETDVPKPLQPGPYYLM
ncbi:bestrophin family protein [Hymenobacter latericus]|uniref:bestrophin family protein n=1 Tax=Hymenobacter sp. YIM 151858-1 TaxID=2987688 RepID=UPI00222779A4|nr:bestrophin family ion channel [Hymenobacter sp. YIM 151858-1]UYZ59357.1 hypothetical protein OIS50_00820 [Hymenobacter sp. YIM 151858-1]